MDSYEDVESSVSEFRNKFAGGRLSIENLQKAVVEYESIIRKLEKISAYSFLQLQTNVNDQKCSEFFQKASEWLSGVQANLVFFDVDLLRLDIAGIKKTLRDSKYLPWIENIFRFKKHMLSIEGEEVIALKNITSNSSWIRLYDEILAKMEFEVNGTTKTLSEIIEIINHSDDENLREKASKSMGELLKQYSFYIKHIYNNVMLNLFISAKLRKYETPEDVMHVCNNIDKESVNYLVQAVVDKYRSTSHKYYKIKAKLLGKDKLQYWDKNVHVKKSEILDRKFSYEDAVGIVLRGYGEFSQEFCDIAGKFVKNGWIDVMPKFGKTSGAFSHHASCDVHPYILLNFFGGFADILTLAHELGHGIHQTLAAQNGPLLAETPLTLSETASIFGEKLIFESMLENASNDFEKVDMLCSKLDNTVNSVIRQIAFFEFEKEVHLARQQKELSAEEISTIWLKKQGESLGEYVEIDEEVILHYWSYISHFFHCPFYVYAYAFGEIFVNSLYNCYKNGANKQDFVKKYTCLLSDGGGKRYNVAASVFSLNVKSLEFWTEGMATVEKQVDDLEALCRGSSLC